MALSTGLPTAADLSTSGIFLSIKDGEVLNIAMTGELKDKLQWGNVHEIYPPKGQEGRPKYFQCLGAGCPACRDGLKPKRKFYLPVFSREEKTIKVWGFGTTVYKQLSELHEAMASEADEREPILKGLGLRFSRSGSGLLTRYSVTGTSKYIKLPDDLDDNIEEHLPIGDPAEIAALYKKPFSATTNDADLWSD